MHRYRIVTQISLILSILNLVLAAPIVVQEIHEARGDEMVVAKDVATMPKKWRELEAASYRSMSPRSPQPMDAPQDLSDGSASSGYPAPYLSEDESVSGYSWLLDRPPRLSPERPESLHDSDSTSVHPDSWSSMEISPEELLALGFVPMQIPNHPSPALSQELAPEGIPPSHPALSQELTPLPLGPHPSVIPNQPQPSPEGIPPSHPALSQELAPEGIPPSHPALSQELAPEGIPPSHPALSQELTPLPQGPHPSGPSEIPPSPQLMGSDRATIDPEGLVPIAPHHLTSDAPSPSPPTETPPDNAEFFNKNMIKTLKIVAGAVVVGGAIAGILGSQIKHRDSQDR